MSDRATLVALRLADATTPAVHRLPHQRLACASCRALCIVSDAGLRSAPDDVVIVCTRCARDLDASAPHFTTQQVRETAIANGVPAEILDRFATLSTADALRMIDEGNR